jgi:hypothetical protein
LLALDGFWWCFGLFYNVHGFSRMLTDWVLVVPRKIDGFPRES